ncbi:MAG: tRNA (N6-isopentenyl adenosine(37)-C2)-methylthiotransferase MiaB [bacterium]
MNLADSERLAGVLETAGYTEAKDHWDVDILVVNTCVVRQSAEDRAAWFVTSAKGQKEDNPNMKIVVCGCFVSEPGRDVRKQFPHVDLFLGPNEPEKLEAFLVEEDRTPSSHRSLRYGLSAYSETDGVSRRPLAASRQSKRTAWVTIMQGCDNFCSYCVVPYVRGREKSRTIDDIMAEIKAIDLSQFEEIYLLGQNVNSYAYGLANLLREINKIVQQQLVISHSSLDIKFMTNHPKDMSDEIIDTVAELPHVAKSFHLPIQHGDDEILKSMNRGYTVEQYKKIVAKIRAKVPDAKISCDVIVGYPGETEEQFENTLKIIREVKYSEVRMAAYSPRPNTAAAALPNQLSDEVKKARLQRLIELVREVVKS